MATFKALRFRLSHLAALLASSACGGNAAMTADAGGPGLQDATSQAEGSPLQEMDAQGTTDGTADSGSPASADAGSDPDGPVDASDASVVVPSDASPCPPSFVYATTNAQVCGVMQNQRSFGPDFVSDCADVCVADGGAFFGTCAVPMSFAQQVMGMNPDPFPWGEGGVLTCPDAGTLSVTCQPCTAECCGRLTAGFQAPVGSKPVGDASRLADMAYLEAVSVHAFARLERELAAHGAPAGLRRDARRARADEARHTAIMMRLARRRGIGVQPPPAPALAPVRGLLEVALENAVEGCVRETYGALRGLVEAREANDSGLRDAMSVIAADECRHAELAWAVHVWARPRLSRAEREQIDLAMKGAIAELMARDPRLAAPLFAALEDDLAA